MTKDIPPWEEIPAAESKYDPSEDLFAVVQAQQAQIDQLTQQMAKFQNDYTDCFSHITDMLEQQRRDIYALRGGSYHGKSFNPGTHLRK